MNVIYRTCVVVTRIILIVAGNYRIIHKERLKNWRRCIITSNHISYFDPPFIGAILPREIYYLAKSELFRNRLFGAFLRVLNSIPVKRGVVDRTTLDRIKELLGEEKSILIFPEGSRKSYTAKPGIGILVYEMKVPILPVYIENSNHLLSSFLRKKRVNIYIGEWIEPDEFAGLPAEKASYRHIAEQVLARIKSLPHEN
jgi:1-acyl-sn-glycerol-3-phosphate acyltransferase